MEKWIKSFALVFVIVFGSSCGTTRVVFVDTTSDMVRLGPGVRGRVYFRKSGEWVLSKNKVELPEGWYAGGLPEDEE